MKGILLLLALCGITMGAHAQNYQVLSYNLNAVPVNGIKIKTNLPFTNSSQMPTITIEGYSYSNSSPIGLTIVYYIYNGNIINAAVSSFGNITPPVYMANEGGKVVIFIEDKANFTRFNVRAFAKALSAETPANFEGWTTEDEALAVDATSILLVPYKNRFNGTVLMPANGTWTAAGRIGIGTTSPVNKLTIDAGSTRDGINIISDGDSLVYSDIQFSLKSMTTVGAGRPTGWIMSCRKDGFFSEDVTGATMEFYAPRKGGGYVAPLLFKTNGDVVLAGGKGALNGNVGIGTNDTKGYKLAVAGSMIAEKIKVKVKTAWPDYVFAPEYQLPSLQEVVAHIQQHQHLPDMPSAKEVAAEGIDLGEMNRKLLQKIEELTLYIIQQEKRIAALEQHNEKP
ncbi:hypothetical protein [Chitinophaga defluvii]|uniref:Uncharacterized protein n=1 Tax=Chitinophaga defluvii TaxID=3163343 RepID=A0ABV2TDK4_9BACT